ncbi:MAG: fibronectin type III domain-containing protein [Bacteroidetes bacterium]|nr:fibronectin type III domain-containing protein [Bacteroidota bacterium]
MSKVVLELRNASPQKKESLALKMAKEMAGNVNFPDPNPTLLDLKSAADTLSAKRLAVRVAKTALRSAVNEQNAAEKTLVKMLQQEASYIEMASGGDALKIESSSLKSRKKNVRSHHPPKVEGVSAMPGNKSGEILLSWHSLPRSFNLRGYQVRYAFVFQEKMEWIMYDKLTSKSKMKFMSPQPGQRIWIEVRAVNNTDVGPWSDVMGIVAP